MKKLFAIIMACCFAPTLFAQANVQSATVTLSSTQLQHLRGTPVQVVAAPGSGKVLNLVSMVGQYKAGGTAYNLENGGDFGTSLGSSSLSIRLYAAGFIDQTTNHIQFNSPAGLGSQSGMENQPLLVSNNGGGEWTEGDGTVIVTVYYTVVDLQ
jgi:hypothetical protein